jgi:hypothetical protein
MKLVRQFSLPWIVVAACVIVIGCATFEEMNQDAAKVRSAIESEFGGEVQIGWHMQNGRVTSVEVVFVNPPRSEISSAELKRRVTELVQNNFRRDVQQVVVSM